MITLLFFLSCFYLIALLGVTRNDWVYRKRVHLIWYDFDSYKRLRSYEYMLFHFWVWDIKKFMEEK